MAPMNPLAIVVVKVIAAISAAILALLGAAYVGLHFFIWWFFEPPWDNDDFDRDAWIALRDNMDRSNPRGEMYDDLVANHLKVGMTRDEVAMLLGEPDLSEKRPDSWMYRLGMWSGYRMDYDALQVSFDEHGRVTGVRRFQG